MFIISCLNSIANKRVTIAYWISHSVVIENTFATPIGNRSIYENIKFPKGAWSKPWTQSHSRSHVFLPILWRVFQKNATSSESSTAECVWIQYRNILVPVIKLFCAIIYSRSRREKCIYHSWRILLYVINYLRNYVTCERYNTFLGRFMIELRVKNVFECLRKLS